MKRQGLTLIEALVAMFIAAMGMIGILTLFPLGALQMGQALKDARCGQAAQQADGLMHWHWSRLDPNAPMNTSPLNIAMSTGGTGTAIPPSDTGPSYPVLVDPLGTVTNWPASGTATATRVAGLIGFPRTTVWEYSDRLNTTSPNPPVIREWMPLLRYYYPPSIVVPGYNLPVDAPPYTPATLPPAQYITPTASPMKILRFTCMQDDLEYDGKRGAPKTQVERGGRYNWAWLLQRPVQSQPGTVNMKVLVFDQRAPLYANEQSEQAFGNVTFMPGTTQLQIPYSGPRPLIQRGRWICDATTFANNNPTTPLRHANFYRVASINDETPGVMVVELETPLLQTPQTPANYTGTVVVFAGLAEVFDRPPLISTEAN